MKEIMTECRFNYRCLLDPQWQGMVSLSAQENCMFCHVTDNDNCYNHLLLTEKQICCNCAMGNYIKKRLSAQGKPEKIEVVLISANDDEIRNYFAFLLDKIGKSYIFERERTKAVLRILEMEVKLLIIEFENIDDTAFEFIDLIKRIRPKLAVITVTKQVNEILHDRLIEKGVKYNIAMPATFDKVADSIMHASL